MKFEVVRLDLTCACMNYSALLAHVLEGSGGMPPRKIVDFRPTEVLSDAIFEMAETCCELAIVCAMLLYRPLWIMLNIYPIFILFYSPQLDLFFFSIYLFSFNFAYITL